jgi:hypothetical protein
MAIERSLDRGQTEAKIPLPSAYMRVHNVKLILEGNPKLQVWIDVLTFGDAQARQEEKAMSINKEVFQCSLSDFVEKGNPVSFTVPEIKAAAYRYLKAIGITGKDV